MGVRTDERGQSPVEFLDTARLIRVKTLSYCMKLPKRLTFYIGTDTMDHANKVAAYVRAANSIYVTRQWEARLRRKYLTEANNALQMLDGNLGTIYDYLMANPEIFAQGITGDTEAAKKERKKAMDKGKNRVAQATKEIGSLINSEAALIKGLKDSDKQRYKDLPE